MPIIARKGNKSLCYYFKLEVWSMELNRIIKIYKQKGYSRV